ncbi:MAG: hypothetical protein JXC36_08820 [Candidatus Atribacteria bacterium]|nr:hypothetical protein [Candidatus Atribacteria bacterium]
MSDLKGKKLLLLGGIMHTIDYVKRAQELGVHVIVADYLVDSPAKQIADESYLISTTDVAAVVELAKRLKVDGVFTAYLDSMLIYCQQVCDQLHFPFYATAEQINIMTNKDKFKKVCAELGLQVVKEYELTDWDATGRILSIHYPVVIKPVDSGAGKGIFICETEKELRERFPESLGFSKRKKVLFEEYMSGEQVLLFYTIQDGYVSLSAMCDRYSTKEQRGFIKIPTALIFPSKHLTTFKNTDHKKVVNLCKLLNIKNGVLFIEAFIHQERVCIHEAGFRFIGVLVHKIIKEMNRIDTVEMMIRHALTGEMKGYSIKELDIPEFDRWACILFQVARKGKIAKMKGFDKIAAFPEIFGIYHRHKEGGAITQIGTLDQCMSKIFIKANTKNELARLIEEINTTIEVEDEKGKNMLLDSFNPYSF